EPPRPNERGHVALVVGLILVVLKPGMGDLMRDETRCVYVCGREVVPQHDQPEWTAPSGSMTYSEGQERAVGMNKARDRLGERRHALGNQPLGLRIVSVVTAPAAADPAVLIGLHPTRPPPRFRCRGKGAGSGSAPTSRALVTAAPKRIARAPMPVEQARA